MRAENGLTQISIIDPPPTHPDKRPYVYFEQRQDGVVKVGYVGNYREGLRRRSQYERDGYRLLAVIPGGEINEKLLKTFFGRDRAIGRERFHPERIVEYIERLLARHFATSTYEAAYFLPTLPFHIWEPNSESLGLAVEINDQYTFFDTLPVSERVAKHGVFFGSLSLTDDWFTPKKWTDLARSLMERIDLDPATCAEANSDYVNAETWYTKEQNGLDLRLPWFGRVWLNPPYGIGDNSAKSFVARLRREVERGAVKQAVTCLNLNAMCNNWFAREVAPIASAHCITKRIEFIPPAGADRNQGSASNGTVFSYVGPYVERFTEIYAPHGYVMVPSPFRRVA